VRYAFALLVLLPAAAAAQPATGPFAVGYRCEGGQRLLVDYPGQRAERVVVTRGVTRWNMMRRVSADGERYVDEKQTMEWWSKGRSGTLTDLATKKAVACREQVSPKKP
jgi:membrane-bound inhibitor of C-type lysozyme